MSLEVVLLHGHHHCFVPSVALTTRNHNHVSYHFQTMTMVEHPERVRRRPILVKLSQLRWTRSGRKSSWVALAAAGVPLPPLDLTEDNVRQVLADAREEEKIAEADIALKAIRFPNFAQIFDTSVGMTGQAELAELDGPFVKISLKGRFWHERSIVLARVGNYLKQRIPEILEVEIEHEKQLDDSPENF